MVCPTGEANIVEEPLYIDFGILLQRPDHIVDTALRDVFHESHACSNCREPVVYVARKGCFG